MIISFIRDGSLEATINEALGRSVDGFMVTTSRPDLSDKDLRRMFRRAPFVRLVAEYGISVASVLYDQRHGEAQAARHLIELGHREIAEISGSQQNIDAIGRHNGLIGTLREYGLEPVARAVGNFSIESGYEAAQTLFESGKSFTAIAAANDEMAMGAMAYMKQHGLRVPDDISVIGFDDHPFAEYADPPLTTLRQDWTLIARVATDYLIDLIEQPDTPTYQHVLLPEFIVRQSTRRL
jgi:DNA-binding LacI/PurR family transcriptional regulator